MKLNKSQIKTRNFNDVQYSIVLYIYIRFLSDGLSIPHNNGEEEKLGVSCACTHWCPEYPAWSRGRWIISRLSRPRTGTESSIFLFPSTYCEEHGSTTPVVVSFFFPRSTPRGVPKNGGTLRSNAKWYPLVRRIGGETTILRRLSLVFPLEDAVFARNTYTYSTCVSCVEGEKCTHRAEDSCDR